jgi:propanediol dehydratase large subunit
MEHLDTLLEADKDASDTFKNGFNAREIALDTITWSAFNSLIFLDTSAISPSSAIVSPLNLSAPDLALAINSFKSSRFHKVVYGTFRYFAGGRQRRKRYFQKRI